jgi:thiol-disulfide isomerase/thioredoxin
LLNATEDATIRCDDSEQETMTLLRNTCIQVIAAMLAAVPIALAQEPPKNFVIHETPEPSAAVRFEDDHGEMHSVADFRGKVVLLNVWATWCAPCIKEIPALDRLAAALSDVDFSIVAVSVDRKGREAVQKLFKERDVKKLPIYVDRSSEAVRAVRAVGLPTSLFIDREGREFGRVVGPAQWDDPATITFFRQAVAHETKP